MWCAGPRFRGVASCISAATGEGGLHIPPFKSAETSSSRIVGQSLILTDNLELVRL